MLKIYDACNQKSAISFVDEVILRLPFRVLVIQTDNGAEFQSNCPTSTGTLSSRMSATSISVLEPPA